MDTSHTTPLARIPRSRVSASRAGPSIGIPQTVGPQPARRGAGSSHPAVTVDEITHPTRAGQGIELIDIDAVKLAATPLNATLLV